MTLPSPSAPSRRRYVDSWRRIGPTLIVFVCIVGCTAAFAGGALYIAAYCERFLPSSRPPDWNDAIATIPIEYALNSTETNDVVFFGDSAPLYAIDPIYFEELTGLKAYNLASFRHLSVNGFLLTAQAYLARHPAPRLVVLCVSPEVFGAADGERVSAKHFVRAYGRTFEGKSPAVDSIVSGVMHSDGYSGMIRRGVSIMSDYFGRFPRPRGDVHDEPVEGGSGFTLNTLAQLIHERRGYAKPRDAHGPPNKPEYIGVHWAMIPESERAIRALISL